MSAKTNKKTPDKIVLRVEKRELFGKKVKKLRAEGKIPANVYGKDMTSMAIQVEKKDFVKMLHAAGLTQVVYISVDKKEIPSMIQNVHVDPVSDAFLHADFKKVNLSQKIETHVPVMLVGESEAVAQNKGDLLTLITTLAVEALPTDIPQEIEVDITSLKEVDDEVKVSDLKTSGTFIIIEEPDKIIARIAEHKEESIEPEIEVPVVEGEEGAEEGATESDTESGTKGETAPVESDEKAEKKQPAS